MAGMMVRGRRRDLLDTNCAACCDHGGGDHGRDMPGAHQAAGCSTEDPAAGRATDRAAGADR
jgi:hypothetical protein